MEVIRVVGTPAPQGSKKGFAISKKGTGGKRVYTGKVAMVESSKAVKPWREDVRAAALASRVRVAGAVTVDLAFYLARPKGHYRTGKNAHLLRDSAPKYPTTQPDIDKLVRSTLDALTSAGTYTDDSTVVDLLVAKRYADECLPGAVIRLHAHSITAAA